jgi:hypothetical protein
MSAPFTREDLVDAIATAISDSMDVDWNSRDGAKAVVDNCGVFELYEALDYAREHLAADGIFVDAIDAALAKARGER